MPIEDEVKTGEEQDQDQDKDKVLPDAAAALIEEVRAGLKKDEPAPVAPSSQPDAKTIQANREDFKKRMNFTEDQMQLYERDRMVAQAPLLKEMSVLRVERGHKDFDQLRKPFIEEVEAYEKRGVIMNPELADQIFLMVKGRELEAGRYAPPNSQPADKRPAGARSEGASPTRRIAAGYPGSEPSLSGDGGSGGSDEESVLTDREKVYAKVLSVDTKDYAKMKEEKRQGIREIAEHSIRAPEIDMKTANPADRDLNSLWSRNGGKI